jgi:hypothetical protein
VIDVESYCRDIEAFLCRKNDGHLIRITGPAFEQVMGWARQGIPLKVAETGIDRYFERYYRKGPRRRPVRIEFCEADVFDAFDDWRRAVGLTNVAPDTNGGPEVEDPAPAAAPRRSLSSQIEALVTRYTILRGSDKAGPSIGPALDAAVRALDALLPEAAKARGEARDHVRERIEQVQAVLLSAAREALSSDARAAIDREATAELEPFRPRMAPEAYAQTRQIAIDRLVKQRWGLAP